MGFYLTAGAWWFYFDDRPMGRFPLTWFGNGTLASLATRIKFGGEVGSGSSLWPPMGSGRHASAGFGKAAYQRNAFFNPVGGGGLIVNLSQAGSTSGPCYTIDITKNSASAWGALIVPGKSRGSFRLNCEPG
jgi:hypothetical protein